MIDATALCNNVLIGSTHRQYIDIDVVKTCLDPGEEFWIACLSMACGDSHIHGDHLCKSNFSDTGAEFERSCNAISSMSELSKTYIKLSGAFSELPSRTTLTAASDTAAYWKPWNINLLKCFGSGRVMVGNDWPVCNLSGAGANDSWVSWKDVAQSVLTNQVYNLKQRDQKRVWYKASEQAY